jgi:23S rRNA (adenine2503-C2)-methyltransferase
MHSSPPKTPLYLAGLDLKELEELLSPLPRFRASQIRNWILKGAGNFSDMKNIPLALRNELDERYKVFSATIANSMEDGDAKKIVLSLKDNVKIEAVLLSDKKKRLTACLSTQAGCPIGCVFCKTGTLKFMRNLEGSEIAEQFLQLKKAYAARGKDHAIDNIVIMGMGEPLLNLENLRKAILFFTDPEGLNFSRRRITVSTCGICEELFDLAHNGPFVRLALSLTTADEKLRNMLMPHTNANPLKKIKEALLLFQKKSGSRITLEVPLLGGINTRETDAASIADFAKGMESVINIIPWNPVEGLEFNGEPLREPEKKEIKKFITMLENKNLKVTMRMHRGQKIMGACGQLGSL